MKTKVQIDNKARIRKGLEPIQPSITTAEFSVDALNEEEREWVAKHYNDREDSIYLTNVKVANPKDLFTVEEISENAVISAIRERVASERVRRVRTI
jgi:hypothetical protein